MYSTDLDLEGLRSRIAIRWQELSGQPLTVGSLEWAYREVLALIASWAKIDTEKAIEVAYSKYVEEIYKLPYGAANKDAIVTLAKGYTDVLDVNVDNPSGNRIDVFLLAKTGTPTAQQMEGLANYLNSSKVKNMCDTYFVSAATELVWNFTGTVGVSGDPIALKALAETAIREYGASKLRLGAIVRSTDLIALLRAIEGIEDVTLSNPIANITAQPRQFLRLNTVTVNTAIAPISR